MRWPYASYHFPVHSLFDSNRLLGEDRTTVTNKRSTIATTVVVSDITGQENFTLDHHGFQLYRHDVRSSCRDYEYRDDKAIKDEYYPEMEELLKEV